MGFVISCVLLISPKVFAAQTTTPSSADITVSNNIAGTLDTVEADNVTSGDIVRVYGVATGGTPIGVTTSTGTSATVYINQLGAAAGNVYVTLQSGSGTESARVTVPYSAEAIYTAIPLSAVSIANNSTVNPDVITVSGLNAGDIVRAYNVSKGGLPIAAAIVQSGDTTASMYVNQLGLTAGTLYITGSSSSELESARTAVAYLAEGLTPALTAANVTVTNNKVGTNDTVAVTGLAAGDTVRVYSTSTGTTAIGTATVASDATSATVSIAQLGVAAGMVYVSNASINKDESTRLAVAYTSETSAAPLATAVTVTNNSLGTSDTVAVTGLAAGDVVNVYSAATAGTLLGTATVADSATTATVSITQLGTAAGTVYVTVTKSGKAESARTAKAYLAETAIAAPLASTITATNNCTGTPDTIAVTGLSAGEIVKVYSAASGGTAIGTATVASNATSVTISVPQLGTAAGNAYVTLTAANGLESTRTAKAYIAEPVSTAPTVTAITVTNNATGTADTVAVTGLSAGDVVNVYSAATAGTLLGTATVADSATTATVSITQLGTIAGTVYVSVTSTGKDESVRTVKAYLAEAVTPILTASQVTIANNKAGTSDSIAVTGLTAGDVVNVYSAVSGGTAIGTATVASDATSATVSVTQLGTAAGTAYVSLTSIGKNESARLAVTYTSETSAALVATAITVTNNSLGTSDTIAVTGLSAGDTVTAYTAATGGTTLGTATVATGATSATISIDQLGITAGTVYVSVTKSGKIESARTAKAYLAETAVAAPLASTITATNNCTGTPDTISVTGLSAGEVVNVYSAASGGTAIGTATVASDATSVTISVPQLGIAAGNVYVSLTAANGLESTRTAKAYIAEPVSTAPAVAAITVTNNAAGTNDTVAVTGLTSGDVVKVYSSATSTIVLGTMTVADSATTATVTIPQLGTTAGTVYVSLTSTGKDESVRTAKAYLAEPSLTVSTAPATAAITVTNNATGTNDTVAVTGLTSGDVVKVYSTATSTTVIGTATVASGATTATVSIAQLGTTAGSVYVSVTSTGKAESARTAKAYSAEPVFASKTENVSYSDPMTHMDASSVSSDNTAVATAQIDPTNGGNIIITSVSAGTANILINGSTSIYIAVTVAGDGTITGGTVFTVTTDTSLDDYAVNLTAATLSSSNTAVATADIHDLGINDECYDITSVSPGTTTITVTDASGNQVTIPVTVAADGSVTIGSYLQFGAFVPHTVSVTDDAATLGFVGAFADWYPRTMSPGVSITISDGKINLTSVTPGLWVATSNEIRVYKAGDVEATSTTYATILEHVNGDGTIVIDGIIKGDQTFVSTTDISIANDFDTLGFDPTAVPYEIAAATNGTCNCSIVDGQLQIVSMVPGPDTISIGVGTGYFAYVSLFVNGDGTITFNGITKYPHLTVSNDLTTLGLVGTIVSTIVDTTVYQGDDDVVSAAISSDGSTIDITTMHPGSATITVTDANSNTATIDVTVANDGTITIDGITKYAQ
jgi:hypothetical protein